jgi:hypothetical protein
VAHLRLIESPNEWLSNAIRQRKVQYTRLACLMGMDGSLFSKWVNGKAQIPRAALALLAQQLPPSDLSYLLRLKDCEHLADVLPRQARRLFTCLGFRECTPDPLFRRIEDLLTQEEPLAPLARAETLAGYLTDAAAAVCLFLAAANSNYLQPLLQPDNVPRFRFPINHFVGVLLELDTSLPAGSPDAEAVSAFRRSALASLRRQVWTRPAADPMELLAQQFSTHLLARHGDTADREEIKGLLDRRAGSADPLLRRLSFTGLVLGRRDPEVSTRFLRALRRDRELAKANLFFNAFHYSDLVLPPDAPLPAAPDAFTRSASHVLRHLERPEQYASILETEAMTLVHVLEAAGAAPLLQPAVVPRLRSLLREESPAIPLLGQPLRDQFRTHLRRLIRLAD